MSELHGQNLSNVVTACSRTTTPAVLAQRHDLAASLKQRVLADVQTMASAPLLGVYLAGPLLLQFSEEENVRVMELLAGHFPEMDGAALSRCLLATARLELAHKPFLVPLIKRIRKQREELSAADVVSCIWSIYILDFCGPRFQRSIRTMLLERVKKQEVAARTLRDVLPALGHLQIWERLPNSLRRSVWRLAGDELRKGLAAPPPAMPPKPPSDVPAFAKPWCLPPLESFKKRLKRSIANRKLRLDEAARSGADQERIQERAEERDLEARLTEEDDAKGAPPKSAVDDFIQLVRRL